MSEQVRDEFLRQFGRQFLIELVRVIERAYRTAREATQSINKHMKPNVAGTYRWGEIESRLEDLEKPSAISAEWCPNSVNSASHLELRAGRFVVTVGRADEPGRLPPEAEFRNTLIEASQLRLWSDPTAAVGHIVALVTHGPNDGAEAPRFVRVLFPDRDGQIVDSLDLLMLARQNTAQVCAEHVPDNAVPVLREVQPAVGGGEPIVDAAKPSLRTQGQTGTTGEA